MAIDHYSPCPCGSGKKLKFCKCMDQTQDYEKIMRLVEGEQNLAAVDRINSLLEKTPNAAWLLAIKGELTLGMQEMESFKETATRFLKLKPDNPLALMMKSIAASLDGEPIENMAHYILEGMAESRESLPGMTLTAIRLLMQSMAANGKLCLVGFWSDILSALTGDRPENDSPAVDPSINLLAKAPVKLLEDPTSTPWYERLAEVISLSRAFRFGQAETKLRSILRDFPDQPGPLSHLLRAQCALLNQRGAYDTAMKLADHLDLSASDRAYYRAFAFEVEEGSKSLQCDLILKYSEIDSEDRIEQALLEQDYIECPEGRGLEEVRHYYASIVGDEVPAKRVFSIFNRSLKDADGADSSSEQAVIASSVGTVVMFGKQTDKPSRVLFIANQYPPYAELVASVEELLSLGNEIPDTEIPLDNVYVEFLKRPQVIVGETKRPMALEETGTQLVEDFLNMPVALLGESPLEACEKEEKRADLLGLLYHFEGEQSLVVPTEYIDQIFEKLQLERESVVADPNEESLRLQNILDIERIAVGGLNDSQLKGLMIRAMGFGATRSFRKCALELQSRESLKDDLQMQIAARSGLLSILPDIDDRVSLCREIEELLTQAGQPVGRVVIQRVTLLQMAGRMEEAQAELQAAFQQHREDPYLLAFAQQLMQAQAGGAMGGMGAGGGDGLANKMMQNAADKAPSAGASESGSGLVLPGEGGGGASEEGKSKLWLPGS